MAWKLAVGITAAAFLAPSIVMAQCAPSITSGERQSLDSLVAAADQNTPADTRAALAGAMMGQMFVPDYCRINTRAVGDRMGRMTFAIDLASLSLEEGVRYETIIDHRDGRHTAIIDRPDHHEVTGSTGGGQTVGHRTTHLEVIQASYRPEQGDTVRQIIRIDSAGRRTMIFSQMTGSLVDVANAEKARALSQLARDAAAAAERERRAREAAISSDRTGMSHDRPDSPGRDRPERDRPTGTAEGGPVTICP